MLCEVRTFLSLAGAVTRPTPGSVWHCVECVDLSALSTAKFISLRKNCSEINLTGQSANKLSHSIRSSATIKQLQVVHLGRISYQDAVQKQLEVLAQVQEGTTEDTLLLLEHDPVLTLGASFHAENLLHPRGWYSNQGIEIVETDRGGDITYHGPGQLVVYPIFDVAKHGKDLHRWMRDLEQTVIDALREFDLTGERLDVNSGVWIDQKKVCAIGIKIKRWVSMHGIAINCNVDLAPFSTIVPCGIRSHGVTSISQELGRIVTVEDFAPALIQGFKTVFPSA